MKSSRLWRLPVVRAWLPVYALAVFGTLSACGIAKQNAAGKAFGANEEETVPETRTSIVHLFEWKWSDIAKECETHLGPAGYFGVQVSPPNEHRDIFGSPWWQRYQPVSYKLESRSGSREEFIDMVSRCKKAGVGIYVDAVINHMTGGGWGDKRADTGSGGSRYSKYNYPGLYKEDDFHQCAGNSAKDIRDYNNKSEVQYCELVNLADLNTGKEYVRQTIANYLNELKDLGVMGFRLDASKHIPREDLAAIVGKLKNRDNIFLEVIEGGPITGVEYTGIGRVTEFRYSTGLAEKIRSGNLRDLLNIGTDWGYIDGSRAVVFTDNHDNQRGHGSGGNPLTHKEPGTYILGNTFMLAWPYGQPSIMSSYRFTNSDMGPPSDAQGRTNSVHRADGTDTCFQDWVCEHRWSAIANMVRFRNVTDGEDVGNVWSNGSNQIAFSRGNKGFVAFNGSFNKTERLKQRLQTGLAQGSYCDVIRGNITSDRKSCTGLTVEVYANGEAEIDIEGQEALAIHRGSKLLSKNSDGSTQAKNWVALTLEVNAETVWGDNVYVVGNIPELGLWNPDRAIRMNPWRYPRWEVTVQVPQGTFIEFKFLKKLGDGRIVWEDNRSNRSLTTSTEKTASVPGLRFDR